LVELEKMLKRFILWDFKRGSWQYDVMVGIVLAFIFLTPREVFRDGPRLPRPHGIAMLPAENGAPPPFFVDPGLLKGVPENERVARLTELLQSSTSNRRLSITRIEPVLDSEGELQGYMAFARP
jgi:hypothetical protein